MNNDKPGDIATPPVETEVTTSQPSPEENQSSAPNGSEPDINPGNESAMVPSDRLREETEKRRKAEEDRDRLQSELEESKKAPSTSNTDDEIDPDVEDTIRKAAKRLGLVSKEELAAERNTAQVQQDVQSLTATPPIAGIPYSHQDVMDFAKSNNLPITSKSALVAAYKELNWNKIVESERAKAIDSFKNGSGSSAETPSGGSSHEPTEPELTSKTPKERTRERIRNARQKLTV